MHHICNFVRLCFNNNKTRHKKSTKNMVEWWKPGIMTVRRTGRETYTIARIIAVASSVGIASRWGASIPPNKQGSIPLQLPHFPLPSPFPFPSPSLHSLLSRSGPFETSQVWGSAVSSPSGPTSILVYYETAKTHLTAFIIWIFVY